MTSPIDEKKTLELKLAKTAGFRRIRNEFIGRQRFNLVLGAGCSMEIGAPSFESLKRKALTELSGNVRRTSPPRPPKVDLSKFDESWDEAGPSLRESIMSNWLFSRPPYLGSYHDLALLIQAAFFKTIVTYNFDGYLETALHSVGFDDFVTLINGVHDDKFVAKTMAQPKTLTILKTHGDHRHRVYAMTDREVALCGDKWAPLLKPFLAEKLLIIGYAAADFSFLRSLSIDGTGDEIWYVNPQPPPAHLRTVMAIRNSTRNWIKSKFGGFTQALYYELVRDGVEAALKPRRTRVEGLTHTAELTLINKLGIHSRTAAMICRVTNRYRCEVIVEKGEEQTNAKSIMGLMMLTAEKGDRIKVYATGDDAAACIKELATLIEAGFGEE